MKNVTEIKIYKNGRSVYTNPTYIKAYVKELTKVEDVVDICQKVETVIGCIRLEVNVFYMWTRSRRKKRKKKSESKREQIQFSTNNTQKNIKELIEMRRDSYHRTT